MIDSLCSSATLVLATGNPKKRDEMLTLLDHWPGSILSLNDFPDLADVAETGQSFAENAAIKATTVAIVTRHWTLADDSGLEVDALAGRPGVYSARYAGEPADSARNNRKLLAELSGVPTSARTARFVCSLAVSDPEGVVRYVATGECRGRILSEFRGTGGFGYDPLFLVPEYGRTFASLGTAVKSVISHRARAFRRLWRSR